MEPKIPKQNIQVMEPKVLKQNIQAAAAQLSDPVQQQALSLATEYVERWIPKQVSDPGQYCPAYCPTCGREISIHHGDGYYEHPLWIEYCPNDDCHQKLAWWDEDEDE